MPLLVLELQRTDLPHGDQVFLDIVNWVVLVAFALDYVVELRLAGAKADFVKREWTSLLIVLAQAVAVVDVVRFAGALRVLRIARAWRPVILVVRAMAIGGAVASEGRQILVRHAAGFAMAVAGVTWLSSAVAFTLIEDVGVEGRVGLRSFFDALWWSSTTITTVGYGDLAPQTVAGRVVAVVLMVVGISSFAVITAKLAEFLVRSSPADADSGS